MAASGVYYYLIDESYSLPGSNNLRMAVPMMTQKGRVNEFITVTADDYEDLLGADISYNPLFLGLKKLLQNVASVDVFRLNKNAYCANVYDTANSITSYSALEQDASLEEVAKTFWIQAKTPGKPKNYTVRVDQQYPVEEYSVNITIVLSGSIDITKTYTYLGSEVVGVVYDSDQTTPLAVLKVVEGVNTIFPVENGAIGDLSCGTFTTTGLTFTTQPEWTDSFCYVKYPKLNYFTMVFKVGDQVTQKTDFSLVTASDIYYTKVDFGDFSFNVVPDETPNLALLNVDTSLANGSNGVMPAASQLDLSEFETSFCNVFVANGLSDISVINAIAQKLDNLDKKFMVDVPDFEKFLSAKSWKASVFNSENVQLHWIWDHEETEIGSVAIAPSINKGIIYANMYSNYGSLNYPPAGPTYGVIAVTQLTKTDYSLYKDELKSNRINYQVIDGSRAMMWEERTTYAKDTDLSFAYVPFVMQDLKDQIVALAKNYNFLYTSSTMLTTFSTGLTQILDGMVNQGFLSMYNLKVPTFAEAIRAGRVLNIDIRVSVTSDSEEIVFRVRLRNANNME